MKIKHALSGLTLGLLSLAAGTTSASASTYLVQIGANYYNVTTVAGNFNSLPALSNPATNLTWGNRTLAQQLAFAQPVDTLGVPPRFIAYLFEVQFNGGIDIFYSGSDPTTSRAILPAQDPNIYNATYAYVTAAPPPPPAVNAGIALTRTGIALNRATNLWVQTDTLTNTTAAAIAGPIYLALDSLIATATLTNGTGVTTRVAPLGSPYVQVLGAGGSLAPGASVSTVLLFANPTRAGILYTGRVLSGGVGAP